MDPLGGLWRAVLGPPGEPLGAMGRSGAAPGSILGRSWAPCGGPRPLPWASGAPLGGSWTSLGPTSGRTRPKRSQHEPKMRTKSSPGEVPRAQHEPTMAPKQVPGGLWRPHTAKVVSELISFRNNEALSSWTSLSFINYEVLFGDLMVFGLAMFLVTCVGQSDVSAATSYDFLVFCGVLGRLIQTV